MAIGRISGSVLKSNLTRNGTDLAFETNLLYLDVTNSRVGIGTSEPSTILHVNGTITTETIANSGNINLDASGGVNLDGGNGTINLKDDGTKFAVFRNDSSDLSIEADIQDKDIKFKGNDGGSTITALTLDMSTGGEATFSNKITTGNTFIHSGSKNAFDVGTSNLEVKGSSNGARLFVSNGGVEGFSAGSEGGEGHGVISLRGQPVFVGGNSSKGFAIGRSVGWSDVTNLGQDDLKLKADVTITGDLTVSGDTTTVSTTNTTIADNIIELNTGISQSSNDAGIIIERGSTGNNAAIIWDESADKFIMGTTTATAADKSGGVSVTTGTLVANIEGNAATATALATARNIAGQSFDGTSAITIASTDLSNTSAIALLTASQTLTNKTLTSPVIADITSTADIDLTATNDVNIPANVGLTFGDDGEKIEGDGTDLTINSSGDVIMKLTGEQLKLNDGTSHIGQFDLTSNHLTIEVLGNDKDMFFKGWTGASQFTALTLDMSGSGAATFNSTIAATGLTINSAYTLPTADGSAGQVLATDGSGTLSFATISTNSVSQGNSNVTVTDSGTGIIGITTDGTNIVNFSTALAIDASNSNTALRLPVGTSGQRPAGAVGMIRYNSSTDKIEGYTTAEGWAEFGAGASSSSDETGDSVIGIGPNPKNITTFTTGTYDSAFLYAILRDESNDEVSTARYSLVHNDTGAFLATSHVNESDTANNYMTVDADITDGVVRLRGTGASNINSISYYEIPLGDNTEAGTTGNVTKFINTDVDSASEVIDSFALSSIRGAKYFISTKDDVSGEVSNTEAIVVHDGSTAYITQYGSVNATDNNRDLLTLTVEVDSTVVLVKASSSIANVRVTGYRIALGDSESADTGDNVNIVAATTVNSGATALDTFASDVYTGAFYLVVGYNSTEGAASMSEVSVVTNGGVSYVSTGPVLSTKGTDQLSFTTGVSGTTVTLNAASTSGSSTTVNAYRVHMLRGIGGAVADTVTVSDDETISGIKTFTSPLTLTVGSDPSTVANNAHIYAKDESSSAEVFVRDEAGNVTKISPHNEQGEWEYYSRNTKTGKTVRVNMEEMIRDIEKLTGKKYIKDF